MSSFSFTFVAGCDDADEHGEEDFRLERKEIGELFEEKEDDASESKGKREGKLWWGGGGGECRRRRGGEESNEEGTEVSSKDEE